MSLLDRVPGDLNLYIGGMFTLRRRDALQQANITHVVSVLRMPLDEELFRPFKHMVVEVDDVEDENLLQHFPAANQFIQEGLDGGGGVLVHCAMGKSRSATCVVAFLMHKHNVGVQDALAQVRRARSIVEPNEGFMQQLELYARMRMPDDPESTPEYQRWVYQREIELSRACEQAPEAEKIRFEDEHAQQEAPRFELRCRKCRRPLATSQYLVPHSNPSSTPSTSTSNPLTSPLSHHPSSPTAPSRSTACAHHFLDPLSWMRPELEQGRLDGRLECPNAKCRSNVGKYAWQGMRCSCGAWVVPGISLAKGKVDEVRVGAALGSGGGSQGDGGVGIRRPPGMKI